MSAASQLRCLICAAVALAALSGAALAQTRLEASADSVGLDWSRVAQYRIVPGDELNLNFGPNPQDFYRDVVRAVTVRPDGRITVFPVGDVVAAGKTPTELEQDLVQLLSRELLSPRVVVEVAKLAGNQVHVLGSVGKPGSYEAGPFITVLQAITMAGGFTEDASRNSVLVFHRDGANTVQVRRIRLDDGIKSVDLALDAPLSRFDIVYIPRSTVGNIGAFVRQVFGPAGMVLGTALIGWELIDRTEAVVVSP